jgi:large subunit ribosomal protein L30
MVAFKKPGRTTRDRKPAAKRAAADRRAAAAAEKAASGRAGQGRTPRVKPAMTGATIVVTQVRSEIGNKPKTRATLRALGLRGIGQSNTLPDRPEIRGMIATVPHLIDVEEGR